nr:hypothetical protein GCM10023233_28150 [Brevibacterium otitidis]
MVPKLGRNGDGWGRGFGGGMVIVTAAPPFEIGPQGGSAAPAPVSAQGPAAIRLSYGAYGIVRGG